jgi:hypothetical protein
MRRARLLGLALVITCAGALAGAACSSSGNDDGSGDADIDGASDANIIVDGTNGNDGAQNDATTATDAGLTNWFPGHYIQLASASISTTEQGELATVLAKEIDPFVGVQIQYDWWKFEGDRGDYSAGFAALDSDLAAVAGAKKKLIIFLQYKNFTNTGGAVPNYMLDAGPWCIDAGECGQCVVGNGQVAIVWQGQDAGGTADRLHAWIAAVGNHVMTTKYASTVAGVVFAETAGGCTTYEGYSPDVYLAGLEADVLAAGAAFPGVPIFQYVNFMPGSSNEAADLAKYATWAVLHPFAGAGCPDVAPLPYPNRPDGCTTQAFSTAPPGYQILLDASVQGTIPFNVAIEREDMLLCATPDLVSTYDTAIKKGPAGMAAQYVVWSDYQHLDTNAFGIDDVGAFIADAGTFPNSAMPTW